MTLVNLTRLAITVVSLAVALAVSPVVRADNPIIQTNFTADPAPLVHNGVVYLYAGHDEDDAEGFKMLNWRCYTSTDMVNWTDRGTVASLATFPWAVQENDAWALQVVERDGKFYMYAPVSVPGWPKNVIAVAVSDNPLGPFKDVLGRPLIDKADGYIDPSIWVDDDGQAYLYWGNPHLWYIKLNKDMISTEGPIVKVDSKPQNYQEGPWFYKRNSHYYMAYASTCCPEGLGYAMSNSPTGPWEYKGYIMKPDGNSSGNHPGIIDYKGSSYVFGFNYALNRALTDKHRERRSICVAKMEYNSDGTIQELPWWTKESAPQIGTLDPYTRVETETICWSEGMKSEPCSDGGLCVLPTRSGAFIKIKGVDFGTLGAATFAASIFCDNTADAVKGSSIEIRLDSVQGPIIGTLTVSPTGGQWKAITTNATGATGTHDLFLVFNGDSMDKHLKVNYWQFTKKTVASVPHVEGQNPIFTDAFTADPAALVVGDTVYAYVGHDTAQEGQFFTMPEWLCYSSKDMKTWKAHGSILKPEDFAYGTPGVAWAAQTVKKDNKYYLYITSRKKGLDKHIIAVAVGDSPTGPFKDARGTPLITDDMTTDSRRPNADIDPTVFIDTDGTPWMAWGNGDCYLVKLKRNMIELDGPIQKLDMKDYAEGPWLFKRGDLYYNVYAADVPGTVPEQIAYATAPKITGPWTHRGLLTGPAKKGFTIHPAVIEFKGQWYFFYHDGSTSLNGIPGGDCRRSVCVEYLNFNPDGTLRPIVQTTEGVSVPPAK